MDKKIKLSIILVSYNTKEYTKRALESIITETKTTDYEVIVVDNNSTDGSYEELKANYKEFTVVNTYNNLGFAGGVHKGVELSKGEYLLLLNPDTVVVNRGIDNLFDFAIENPNNGIWGGVTLNNDLSVNTQHAWARHDLFSLLFSALGVSKVFSNTCIFNKINYGCWRRDSVKEVDIISGCFFLTTRELWESLGGLDCSFFMYAEEADYCLRASKMGHKPIVTPNARVIHHGGVSHNNLSSKMIKLLKGKVELIKRHDDPLKQKIYIALLVLYVKNKLLFSVLSGNNDIIKQWREINARNDEWKKGYPNE